MFNSWLLFWWAISVVAFISFLLLSYAFRDFSFLLLVQSSFTFLGLVLSTYFLTRNYNPQPSVIVVNQDKETGETTSCYQYLEDDESEDNQANGFFNSCR